MFKKAIFLLVVASYILQVPAVVYAAERQDSINFGITGVVIKEDLMLHKKLLEYISKRLGKDVRPVFKKSYKEMDWLLKKKDVDIAWICGAPYVKDKERFGAEILAIPLLDGKAEYYSLVIAANNSSYTTLADFRGKRYAFSDPLSNSGRLVPTYKLALWSSTPENFFKEYIYTFSHFDSIVAVANKFVDGASVDSYVYKAASRLAPEIVKKTKIVERYGPYGFTPLVVRGDSDEAVKQKLREILFNMKNNPEGQAILKQYGFDGFIQGSDDLYDSIRKMQDYIADRVGSRKKYSGQTPLQKSISQYQDRTKK